MAQVQELLGKLQSSDQAEAFRANRELGDLVTAAGKPDAGLERTALAAALAAEINADIPGEEGKPPKGKKYNPMTRGLIARHLWLVAGEAEVPALKETMQDFGTREMARWALEGIVSPAGTALLILASQNAVGPEFRVGVINALAKKSGPEVIAELKRASLDDDVEVRTAAAEALANFPEPTSDAVLAAVLKFGEPSPRIRERLLRARLRLAETLVKAGQVDAGKAIYQAMVNDGGDGPQIKAAKRALDAQG
jgi:hypothetical protein